MLWLLYQYIKQEKYFWAKQYATKDYTLEDKKCRYLQYVGKEISIYINISLPQHFIVRRYKQKKSYERCDYEAVAGKQQFNSVPYKITSAHY